MFKLFQEYSVELLSLYVKEFKSMIIAHASAKQAAQSTTQLSTCGFIHLFISQIREQMQQDRKSTTLSSAESLLWSYSPCSVCSSFWDATLPDIKVQQADNLLCKVCLCVSLCIFQTTFTFHRYLLYP